MVLCMNKLPLTFSFVSVKRARGLNVKGKNGNNSHPYANILRIDCGLGTNDAFVTIGLGKEKFQTSVKERSEDPEWSEQCELWVNR